MTYLVNGWLVQPELNRIITQTQQVQLEPRTMRLFVCLIQSEGKVVTREQLTKNVWGNVEVCDYSLSRSISDIRTTFKENPNSTEVIETIRKVGYRFTAQLEEPTTTAFSRKRKGTLALVAALFLIAVSYLIIQPNINFPKLQSVIPQTSKSGVELTASYSRSGDRIVYFYGSYHLQGDFSDSGLEITTVESGQSTRLDTPGVAFSPAWSWDDNKIAYKVMKKEGCFLFYHNFQLQKNVEIGACPGTTIQGRSIGEVLWIPGDKKLLVNAPTYNNSHQLWEVDLETGQSYLSPDLPYSTMGLYYPQFSKNGRYLGFVIAKSKGILIKELNPVTGSITKLDWNTKALVAKMPIEEEVTGFDFDTNDEYIVYSSAEESLRYKLWYSDFDGNRRVLHQDSAKIGRPKISSKRSLIYEQRDIDKDIIRINLKKRSKEIIVNSTRWDMLPNYDRKNEQIAFVSTRSGNVDIWMQNKINAPEKKIDLAKGANTHPQFSPTQDQLVFISTNQHKSDLFVSDLTENSLRQITNDEAQENYPTWSIDGNWIYFSRMTNGYTQLWKIDQNGTQSTQITEFGSNRAQEIIFDGKKSLLYSKDNNDKLWLKELPDGEERKLSTTIKIHSPTSWQFVKQNIYYLTNLSGKTVLNQYDIRTEEVIPIITLANSVYQPNFELALSSDGEFALITVGSDLEIDLIQLSLE